MSVNEWPAPTTFTGWPAAAAVFTNETSSASVAGCSTATGAHDWLRAQFLHVVISLPRSSPSVARHSVAACLRRTAAILADGCRGLAGIHALRLKRLPGSGPA